MQKSSQKGSILLWAIGISLILVFLFASFSTRLSEKIRFEKGLVGGIQSIFQEDSYTPSSGSSDMFRITKVSDPLQSLQEKENREYHIESTNPVAITITLEKWGPLYFKFISFSWATLFWGTSSSWFVDSAATFTGFLTQSYDKGILYIKNLWWYTAYSLTGSDMLIPPSESYKVTKKVAWEQQIQRNIKKVEFVQWTWSDIDYEKMWMSF